MAFANYVKSLLLSDISRITQNPALFVNNPGRDFTRNRKISMQNLLEFYICMESGNLQHELLKYFHFRSDTASVSAFHQQRSKLKPETFLFLLKQFNRHFRPKTYKESYRLIACDGSEFNISLNEKDTDSYYPPAENPSVGSICFMSFPCMIFWANAILMLNCSLSAGKMNSGHSAA